MKHNLSFRVQALGRLSLAAVLSLFAVPVLAVQANFDLNANGTQESSAISTVAGIVCVPCTITHSIYNGIVDATYQFNWTGAGFSGTAPAASTVSSSYQTYNSVVSATGNVSWTPIGVTGNADYYFPVTSAVVYYAGELVSTLFRSPENITFAAKVEQIDASEFRYTYTVTNYTAASAPFTWSAAGMSGTLAAHGTSVRTFVSPSPAVEVFGSASFTLSASLAETSLGASVIGSPQAFAMSAHLLAPVPEPEQYALMLVGVALVGAVVRLRQRAVAPSRSA